MRQINIDDIDFNMNYEGYLWYSNKRKPEQRTSISKEDFKRLPFIVEGYLYSEDKKISISISFCDGEYFIFSADLKSINEEQITRQEYIAHDLEGITKIKMLQYWEESAPEELLANMSTLIPSWLAFTGFIKD